MATKKEAKYKDFIEFTPKAVGFLNPEQTDLGTKFGPIIKALRERNMTAKEIHNLYIDDITQKHTCTLKTIYRHLEKLEVAELVTISGHRLTVGKSLTEKLYSRTAITFFKSMAEKNTPEALEKRERTIEKLYLILEQVSDPPIISKKEFGEIIHLFFDYELDAFDLIAKKAPNSDKLQTMYSEIDIDFVNYLNDFAARFLVFMTHPELAKRIQNIQRK